MMIKIKNITYGILLLMLLNPLIAYIYIVYLKLPKTILHFYVFFIFIFGLIFILKKKKLKFPIFLWFLLIYAIYRLIWLQIAAVDRHPLTDIYYSLLHFSIFFVILIIYNTDFSDKFKRSSIQIMKITVVITALVSVIQVFNESFFNPWRYWGKDPEFSLYAIRRVSIFGFIEPNSFGLSYIPLLSILVGYSIYKKNKNYYIFLLLGGISSFLSNNRYVMIGFIIVTLIVLIGQKVNLIGFLKYALIIAILGFFLTQALLFFGYDFNQWYKTRLFHEGSIYETTRYKAIGNFLVFFPEKPIFGTGVHLTEEIREASREIGSSQIHIGYLSHLISYGIVGSFFLFGFWFILIKKLYKNAKKTNYWGSFFAFIVFFFAQVTLVKYSIFYTGLIFAFVFDKYFQDKYRHNNKLNKKDFVYDK